MRALNKTGSSDPIIGDKSIFEVVAKVTLLRGSSIRHLSLKICGHKAMKPTDLELNCTRRVNKNDRILSAVLLQIIIADFKQAGRNETANSVLYG